jgi:signal transduction histidine kinase
LNIFERPLFASLSLVYCLCLAAFALYRNRHSRLNQTFAAYNISNALFNAGDFVFLFANKTAGLWFVRNVSIGGALMLPFLFHFICELTGAIGRNARALRLMYGISLFFSALHFTPLIYAGVNYTPFTNPSQMEIPGGLYPIFALYLLLGLFYAIKVMLTERRRADGLIRKQLEYVGVAGMVGAVALGAFFLNLLEIDLPYVYYPLQALVAFIFGCAIFRLNLMPIEIALRRASLLVGIYIAIVFVVTLMTILYQSAVRDGSQPLSLYFLILMSGAVFSAGPLVYARMIRRFEAFQDRDAAQLTHELKTPLHAIQSARHIIDEEMRRQFPDKRLLETYSNMIDRNSDRLEGFVTQLLDLLRAGGNVNDQPLKLLDLSSLFRRASAALPDIEDRIIFSADGSLQARGNEEGIFQVFLNLLSNARKYAPRGQIEVTLRKVGSNAEISVRDTGMGISKAELKKIFQPFVRGSNGAAVRGSGLGLAIAQRWVLSHNGQIWAESEGTGHGSRFVIVLPLTTQEA